ncbi:MAG: CCE_0567 family metalloprotein [Synechococcus lacustris]
MTSNGDDFRQLDSEVLRQRIRSLNSKAGQMKMDLHDLAEGLPADFEQLPGLAAKTHAIFAQLDAMRRHLREQEATSTPT